MADIASFRHPPGTGTSMEPVVIYHNPRCSKSRAALALLEENGVAPEIFDYLSNPPDAERLRALLDKLGTDIRGILRRNEAEYGELGLDDETLSDEIILDIVARHPRLIQRPILVRGDRAIIARPPEAALQFIDDA